MELYKDDSYNLEPVGISREVQEKHQPRTLQTHVPQEGILNNELVVQETQACNANHITLQTTLADTIDTCATTQKNCPIHETTIEGFAQFPNTDARNYNYDPGTAQQVPSLDDNNFLDLFSTAWAQELEATSLNIVDTFEVTCTPQVR